ncbi:hypothetical protein SZ41_12110 [Brachyspira hyodysenteriae]|uniref:hypothetical protein n=1 Tax=Brachyspira hyodysenteriae TaxID=159 RepID=UPI00063DD66D|nr:hypothetical protein [Brachyspira hyodysenteriae]KLI46109.1 hypothetical protein SZ41_12110 [Brachyspira hyodysenteriae]
MNTNLNKYGILILQNKKVNEKDRDAEIKADSQYMKAGDIKLEDLDCDAFRDFYGSWRGKDIKSLITMEAR